MPRAETPPPGRLTPPQRLALEAMARGAVLCYQRYLAAWSLQYPPGPGQLSYRWLRPLNGIVARTLLTQGRVTFHEHDELYDVYIATP